MNHQCGRRSRTTSSLSLSSLVGKGTRERYFPILQASAVSELAEAAVRQTEVVADLVDDRDADHVDHVVLGRAAFEDRQPVDRDPVRHAAADAITLSPRERDTLVETEEVAAEPDVVDEHRDVLHQLPDR